MFKLAPRQSGLVCTFALTAVLVSTGCSSLSGDDHDGFTSDEWKLVLEMQPLGKEMPANPCNHKADDDRVAKLGQMLFFETAWADPLTADGLSGKKGETGKVGCVTCHDQRNFFVDTRADLTSGLRTATSSGLGAPGRRNTPAMVNLGWNIWTGWTGRFDWLTMHGAGALESATTRLAGAHYVFRKYRAEYDNAFPTTPLDPALDPMAHDADRFPPAGRPKPAPTMAVPNPPDGPWEMMDPADQKLILQFMYNIGRAWEAYPRKLATHGSAFERYVTGEGAALGAEAKRGLKVFIGKAACSDCHNGPLLSDGKFHNIGVPTPPGATQDNGRFADLPAALTNIFNGAGEFSDDREAGRIKLMTLPTVDDSQKGLFRTPQLLNVEATGPYFHTGQVKTLEEVVEHYNRGGGSSGSFAGVRDPKLRPLLLSDVEKADLVAFLKSLTGNPPDEAWTANIAKP
jgi:cytochrome c peroxidase